MYKPEGGGKDQEPGGRRALGQVVSSSPPDQPAGDSGGGGGGGGGDGDGGGDHDIIEAFLACPPFGLVVVRHKDGQGDVGENGNTERALMVSFE